MLFFQKVSTGDDACLYLRIPCDHFYGHACRKYDASGPEVEEAWKPRVFERRLGLLLFMRLPTNSTSACARSKPPTDAFNSIDTQRSSPQFRNLKCAELHISYVCTALNGGPDLISELLKDASLTGMSGSNGDHCRDLAQKASKINRRFPVLSMFIEVKRT